MDSKEHRRIESGILWNGRREETLECHFLSYIFAKSFSFVFDIMSDEDCGGELMPQISAHHYNRAYYGGTPSQDSHSVYSPCSTPIARNFSPESDLVSAEVSVESCRVCFVSCRSFYDSLLFSRIVSSQCSLRLFSDTR